MGSERETPLWHPSPERARATRVSAFLSFLRRHAGVELPDFGALYDWSIREPAWFWGAFREFAGVRGGPWEGPVLEHGDRMPGARWFPGARLNYAENLLRRRDDSEAIVFRGEDRVRRRYTWDQLHDSVARVARALRSLGVGPGDRVAAFLPNMPETVIAMLAATSIGAVWASTSPDFGARGVLDRFGQIEPSVLFAADGYRYKGRWHDALERVGAIVTGLPSVRRTVVVPYDLDGPAPDIEGIPHAVLYRELEQSPPEGPVTFARVPFDHPLFILFSSGTTGAPKCIVHGVGGTLLQHLKEHQLHCDVRPDDRVFYFTTCGWMMWNWQVSALASRASLLLYDGSPFHPDEGALFDYARDEGMTLFGTSAKYIDVLRKSALRPVDSHRLEALRTLTSTGSPLAPEGFDYVYDAVKPELQLSSISGGTDIIGCFVLGNPIGPVWRGEIQSRGLGLRVEVYDARGNSVREQPGDLVCTAPFPSMPVGFWNDPDGARYRAAYFERFPGVWHHGDWAEITAHDGVIIYGRSDAVLNPGGVRIGTAEIYHCVEQLEQVVESIAIGQQWEGDVRVVLFIVLRPGLELTDELAATIRARLRADCSPHHVPARVVQVADIPRTKSGKITELAVRDVVHGREVANKEALANPEALDLFRDLPELRR